MTAACAAQTAQDGCASLKHEWTSAHHPTACVWVPVSLLQDTLEIQREPVEGEEQETSEGEEPVQEPDEEELNDKEKWEALKKKWGEKKAMLEQEDVGQEKIEGEPETSEGEEPVEEPDEDDVNDNEKWEAWKAKLGKEKWEAWTNKIEKKTAVLEQGNSTEITRNSVYWRLGDGHCRDGYLRGHGERVSLAQCQQKCSQESDCAYVSHRHNACSRYKGSCSGRKEYNRGYTTYRKASPSQEGASCYDAGTDTASRDAVCAGALKCARDGHDGRNFGGCWWSHCCSKDFQTVGDGHCINNYLRGHGQSGSLEDCQQRCRDESDCAYVAHRTSGGSACSRYGGGCSGRKEYGRGYTTYQKLR